MPIQIQRPNCGKIARLAMTAAFVLHQPIYSSALLSRVSISMQQRNTDSKVSSTRPYFTEFATESNDNIRKSELNSFHSINTTTKQSIIGKTAVIAGSTGYIGRACVRECVARGYNTIALVRDASTARIDAALNGASLVECDVTDEIEVRNSFVDIANGKYNVGTIQVKGGKGSTEGNPLPVDIVISCLASPSGIESEVYAIDYLATLNILNAGRNPCVKARHFVLLSAFCCRKPILKVSVNDIIGSTTLLRFVLLLFLRYFISRGVKASTGKVGIRETIIRAKRNDLFHRSTNCLF